LSIHYLFLTTYPPEIKTIYVTKCMCTAGYFQVGRR